MSPKKRPAEEDPDEAYEEAAEEEEFEEEFEEEIEEAEEEQQAGEESDASFDDVDKEQDKVVRSVRTSRVVTSKLAALKDAAARSGLGRPSALSMEFITSGGEVLQHLDNAIRNVTLAEIEATGRYNNMARHQRALQHFEEKANAGPGYRNPLPLSWDEFSGTETTPWAPIFIQASNGMSYFADMRKFPGKAQGDLQRRDAEFSLSVESRVDDDETYSTADRWRIARAFCRLANNNPSINSQKMKDSVFRRHLMAVAKGLEFPLIRKKIPAISWIVVSGIVYYK